MPAPLSTEPAGNKTLLLGGATLYIVMLLLSLVAYLSNVGFMFWGVILMVAQLLLAAPVLLHAVSGNKFPVQVYCMALFALVSVGSISGWLGLPRSAGSLAELDSLRLTAKQEALERKSGELDRLRLQVQIAAEEDEAKVKTLEQEFREVGKDLSEKQKEEIERRARVIRAEKAVARFGDAGRSLKIRERTPYQGLIVIGAMLMLVGAYAPTARSSSASTSPEEPAQPASGEGDSA